LLASNTASRLREQMFDCVLGIDPGVARLGLAAVERRGRVYDLRWAAPVRTASGLEESSRLRVLGESVRLAIAEHRPGAIAIERVAWNRNQVSAIQVARATGAIMLIAAECGVVVFEYGPNEVKQAVTGVGNADKDQVRGALSRIHGRRDVPADPDAADAVAVALTHLAASRLRSAGARALAR
jgi:crossover junction endodeoxyribonuclease RuvC